jgi:outer membrane protein OmpA-like peptidoglycan-associated protein
MPEMCKRERGWASRVLLVCLVVCGSAFRVVAQEEHPAPKVEIYGGYSWYNAGARLNNARLPGMDRGFEISPTYFFNRYFGFTVQSTAHWSDPANVATVMAGPELKARNSPMQPFVHLLVGLHRSIPATSPFGTKTHNGLGLGIGGGLDWDISRRFAIRMIQADFIDAHHAYDPAVSSREWTGATVGGGVVVKFGFEAPPPAPTASCAAQPTEAVFAGEPITVTATPQFQPNRTLTYNWTATNGAKVTGTNETAKVDTTGLQPGTYTVTANISSNKKNETATCSANFTIKEQPKNPPTISCTANPTTVRAGEPSTVTCNAASPDNRPVTVTYQASGGKVSGSGNTATLDTTGAPAGPITVTATATDDRNLTNSTTTTVNVEVPPPPPTCTKSNEISFTLDKVHPARVDNQAKAILDDFGHLLQRQPDAKAVIIGHANPDETAKRGQQNLAAQRAANTAEYLEHGESQLGIDPNRIELRNSTVPAQTAELYLVPAGAQACNPEGSSVVPAGTVTGQSRTAPAPAPRRGRRGARRGTGTRGTGTRGTTGGAGTPPTTR